MIKFVATALSTLLDIVLQQRRNDVQSMNAFMQILHHRRQPITQVLVVMFIGKQKDSGWMCVPNILQLNEYWPLSTLVRLHRDTVGILFTSYDSCHSWGWGDHLVLHDSTNRICIRDWTFKTPQILPFNTQFGHSLGRCHCHHRNITVL
jgi:hypothetical protein